MSAVRACLVADIGGSGRPSPSARFRLLTELPSVPGDSGPAASYRHVEHGEVREAVLLGDTSTVGVVAGKVATSNASEVCDVSFVVVEPLLEFLGGHLVGGFHGRQR